MFQDITSLPGLSMLDPGLGGGGQKSSTILGKANIVIHQRFKSLTLISVSRNYQKLIILYL